LWTCCSDSEASGLRILRWDAATGQSQGEPLKLPGCSLWPIPLLAFLPDGKTALTFVCTSWDRKTYSLRYWDAATGKEKQPPAELSGFLHGDREHVDGWLFGKVGEKDKWLQLTTGKLVDPITPGDRKAGGKQAVTFSADGKRFVTTTVTRTVGLHDAQTGKALGPPVPVGYGVIQGGWSADGRLAVLASADHRPQVWDLARGEPVSGPLGSPDRPLNWSAIFSPDGKRVLTCGTVRWSGGRSESRCQVWEVGSGKEVTPLIPGELESRREPMYGGLRKTNPVFSPDGSVLFLLSKSTPQPPEYILWDVAAGRVRGEPLRTGFDAAAFSPDGRTLWTGSPGKSQTWDVLTGKLLRESAECPAALRGALGYSADGKFLVKWLQFADGISGRTFGAGIDNTGWRKATSPDGKMFAMMARLREVNVYRFPQAVEGSPERIKCWVEVITGMELDADGAGHLLEPDAWRKRKARLEELGGPPIP
jgi:WD40 repeat protein